MPSARIYFFLSVHELLYATAANYLRSHYDVEACGGFAWGQNQKRRLQNRALSLDRLDVFTEWLPSIESAQVDYALLRRLEVQYGQPTLTQMVYYDRHLSRWPRERIPSLVQVCALRVESIFDEFQPTHLVLESIDGLVSSMLFGVAKARGIPSFALDTGRINGRVAVCSGPNQSWVEVNALLDAKTVPERVHQRRSEAVALLDTFRQERPRPLTYQGSIVPSLWNTDVRRGLRGVVEHLVDRNNPTLENPLQIVKRRVYRLARMRGARLLRYFEDPVPGESFLLFPLHYEPEASTLVMAPLYADQLSLIEDLAKSLPIGTKLYVKEHFGSIGRRELQYYARIRRLWNVRLIDPKADSYALLQSTEAVVTISGTMGWEALLLGVPVIAFSDVFYHRCHLVTQAGNASKKALRDIIAEAMDVRRQGETTERKEILIDFLSAVLEGTHEARISLNPHDRHYALGEENVSALGRVISKAAGLDRVADPSLASRDATTTYPNASGPAAM